MSVEVEAPRGSALQAGVEEADWRQQVAAGAGALPRRRDSGAAPTARLRVVAEPLWTGVVEAPPPQRGRSAEPPRGRGLTVISDCNFLESSKSIEEIRVKFSPFWP